MTIHADLIHENEELLQFIYLSPVGIIRFAPDGAVAMMNPKAAQILLPLRPGDPLDNVYAIFAEWLPDLRGLVQGFGPVAGTVFEQRRIFAARDAEQRVLSLTVNRISAGVFMATCQDITVSAEQERRLFLDQQRFRAIFDQVHDYAIYTVDLDGRLQDWNRSLHRLGQWTAADVVGQPVSIFFPPGAFTAETAKEVFARAAQRGWVELEGQRVRRDGSTYWGDAVITALPDPDGNVTGFVVVSRDMTERKLREDELLRLATTDPLTGMFNRRHGTERIAEAMDRFRRYRTPAALMMVDIDHFKRVNDTYGHDAGDAVLQEIARRLRNGVRSVDSVVRWGGEEFLVLLPETNGSAALAAADHLLKAIRLRPVTAGDTEIPVTASIGVATLREDMATIDQFIKPADSALYNAKTAGRNRVVAA